jgi:putative ABC transport system substrate-binding protein
VDRRRFLLTSLAGVLAGPLAAGAQQAARKIARIGIIVPVATTSEMIGSEPKSPAVSALLQGLRELGYVYGRNFVTEPRGANNRQEQVPSLIAELVRLQVDVIVAAGVTLGAVKQATSTIPVVMAGSDDPVGRGHVRSLAHPGGNFTGLSTQGIDAIGKRLELLKELAPAARPVAVLWDQASLPVWQTVEAAARGRAWKLLSLEVRDTGGIEEAFRAATKARASAVLMLAVRSTAGQAERVAELAAKSLLPAMYEFRFYVEAGGLISYGADTVDLWRRSASFVDKILKGAKPRDLPIEQPTKFDLVINLRTANALGLTIPPSLLARADQVIE